MKHVGFLVNFASFYVFLIINTPWECIIKAVDEVNSFPWSQTRTAAATEEEEEEDEAGL